MKYKIKKHHIAMPISDSLPSSALKENTLDFINEFPA
jgi:hypothetical protein